MAFEATAFGLDLRAEQALPCLAGAAAGAPAGRPVELGLAADVRQLGWPGAAGLISDEREADGSVNFQIESRGAGGYRIWGPRYGACVIAADGGSLRGAPGTGGMAAWQRLLVAQALPFVSVLRGLEVFHASAVACGERGVALMGPSGSGKTSLALALGESGAEFLADDVLAVERRAGGLVAHPSAPVASVVRGDAEEVVPVARAAGPVSLRHVYLLERRPGGPERPSFEPSRDPRQLLASTFNLVLEDPMRLVGLLDACALAARQCTIERVRVGTEVTAERLAAALAQRIGEAA